MAPSIRPPAKIYRLLTNKRIPSVKKLATSLRLGLKLTISGLFWVRNFVVTLGERVWGGIFFGVVKKYIFFFAERKGTF